MKNENRKRPTNYFGASVEAAGAATLTAGAAVVVVEEEVLTNFSSVLIG